MEVTKPVSSILRLPPPRRDGPASGQTGAGSTSSGHVEVLVDDNRNFSEPKSRALTVNRLEKSLTKQAATLRQKYQTSNSRPAPSHILTGFPSAPFLAQQLAQDHEISTPLTAGPEYRDAAQAYRDTLCLTAFVVTHDGINHKIA